MKRPWAMAASVPTCSATSTGFQSGQQEQAAGWRVAPLREQAPRIGTFW